MMGLFNIQELRNKLIKYTDKLTGIIDNININIYNPDEFFYHISILFKHGEML